MLQDAATQLGVDPALLTVTAIEAVDWPDSSLGCPEDGGVYAQVISPGYRITVTDGVSTLEYHTGLNDAFVLLRVVTSEPRRAHTMRPGLQPGAELASGVPSIEAAIKVTGIAP